MAIAGGPDFATSDAEAANRYERWKSVDPFPEISPALLNSADIADYVAATGMIYPFPSQPANEYLKSASCGVAIEGPYVYWDEHELRQAEVLDGDKELVLPAQTIVFVTLEPMFRLPDYLAIRFNLRITRVYQGLLLGTGPLVDPGFVGRLSMPLHNLTRNGYSIKAREVLIWLEITKVSELKGRPRPIDPPARHGRFVSFDPYKLNLNLDGYLRKANRGRPIASAIPHAIEVAGKHAEEAENQATLSRGQAEDAREQAERARHEAERIRNIGIISALIGIGALFLGLAGVVLTTFMLVHDVDTRLAGETNQAAQNRAALIQQSAQSNAFNSLQTARLCVIEQQLKLPKSSSCP